MSERHDEIRAMLAGLPEYPWKAIHHSWQESSVVTANDEHIASFEIPEIDPDEDENWEETQANFEAVKECASNFIAAAPQLVARLLDRAEKAEAERDEARAVVDQFRSLAKKYREEADAQGSLGIFYEGHEVLTPIEHIARAFTEAVTFADRQPTEAEIQYGLTLQADAEEALKEGWE